MSAKAFGSGRPSIGSAKSSSDTVRNLLDQLKADLGDDQIGQGSGVDIETLPQKARDVFVLILSHVQEHPALVSSVDASHRDLLVRMMVASSCKRAPVRQGSFSSRTFINDQWSVEESILPKAFHLLGGPRLLKHKPSTQAEIHAAVVKGIPYSMLFFLTANTTSLAEEDVANVLGVSTRTLRRQREAPEKAMPPDLGSKTWLFAETLAKAEDVFGSKEEAERWMSEEVMGLDGARPIDLLRTSQGANLVNQFLERLKYGVYN
jgi:putative toxin-antitoxin system antitoxin component (TIGR02293 family)